LEKAGWVAEHVCAEVPHRQFVFTIPKRLRIYFRFERRQTEVIEKILRHCGLWEDASVRAPPSTAVTVDA